VQRIRAVWVKAQRQAAEGGQVTELRTCLLPLGAAMDLLSRGAVLKALVFLCFIRSSQGIYIFRLGHYWIIYPVFFS
jgi:hypothetical protein